MNEARRRSDNGIMKYAKLWPIFVAALALLSSFVLAQKTVYENYNAIGVNAKEHKQIFKRLDRLEVLAEYLPEMRRDIKEILKGGKHGK